MIRYFLIVLFLIGCEDLKDQDLPTEYINLQMELPTDENGEFYYKYPTNKTSSYCRVKVKTNRRDGRVFWFSPDSFEYIYQNILFKESVINYSSYCLNENDGEYEGEQLIYLNENLIGDTIEIMGYFTEDIRGQTRFLVK